MARDPRALEERFWSKVDKDGPAHPPLLERCWVWRGAPNGSGYGPIGVGRRVVGAHRWAYAQAYGPVSEGHEVDHLCHNRLCVNPAHLEAVTKTENVRRGTSPFADQARRTHCPKGHPYDTANTRWYHNERRCHACTRAVSRECARRRTKRARGIPHESRRGERSGTSKLTWPLVAEIRRRAQSEPQRALAREYGVSETTVSLLVNRKTWVAP